MTDKKRGNAEGFSATSLAIAADLESLQSNVAISVASMTVELRSQIRSARAKGISFKQIAETFQRHGLAAEADTIRIALGRNVITKAARARKTQAAKPAATAVAPSAADSAAPRHTVSVSSEAPRNGANIAPRLK